MSETRVLLPASLFDQLTDYLIKQPYSEVYGLLDLLKEKAQVVATEQTEVEVEGSSDD
jgi:hypothetical protein